MNSKEASHPLWAGFVNMVQSIFAIEIGVYLYYALIMRGEFTP